MSNSTSSSSSTAAAAGGATAAPAPAASSSTSTTATTTNTHQPSAGGSTNDAGNNDDDEVFSRDVKEPFLTPPPLRLPFFFVLRKFTAWDGNCSRSAFLRRAEVFQLAIYRRRRLRNGRVSSSVKNDKNALPLRLNINLSKEI